MKFNDIPAEVFSLRMVQLYGGASIKERPVSSVALSVTNPGEYEIFAGRDLILATPVDKRQAADLDREFASGQSYLARITDIDANNGFSLEVAFFAKDTLEFGSQDIGVDEYVAEQMGKIWGWRGASVDGRFLSRLEDEFLYRQGDDYYFFMLAGSSIDDELDQGSVLAPYLDDEGNPAEDSMGDDLADDTPEEHKMLSFSRESSFCVVSENASFVATEKPVSRGGSIYVATKMHKRKGASDKAIRLAHGKLSFVDWTAAGQVQIPAKSQLADIVQENSSYLKTWDDFGSIEGEILLREARDFGVIYYNNSMENRDGTCSITIADCSRTAAEELASGGVEGLEFVEHAPSYVVNKELTFSDFSKMISKSTWRQPKYCKVLDYDETSRQITLDVENLPQTGKFILSLQGDITQIRRRNSARRAILEGRSANPQLGLLLEENGQITSLRLPKKVKPLTAFVRKKVFKNDPTYMQEKAIEVALNTPDIALIQGPPGTGKTTVIAAIVERLNQESTKKGTEAKGQVLLTGFQHDAVENMIDRISLNSIPVPKIGKRSGQTEDDITAFERSLDAWCESIVNAIREKYPELDQADQYKDIDILAAQYAMAPTQALAATLMKMVSEVPAAVIGSELVAEAGKLALKLSVRSSVVGEGGSKYARAVRLLRTSDAGFLDDGPDRADDALDILDEQLSPKERKLLRDASMWNTSKGIPPFMGDLKRLKKALLIRYSAPPVFRVEKENQEVLDLLIEYKKRVTAASASNKDKRLAALAEFVAELENDGVAVSDAVSEYSFAFAATCQQSAGQKMQNLKGLSRSDDPSGLVYDYVIVDEAARVSPRDLMVPMAQGKRIILVGDHRQLPHIIDEEVAQQMEDDGAAVNETEWLKKSMFEYLFTERLKALEMQDGIKRRVTLDKQFRMHPLIGDFISRNFYERFDPDEKVSSGLPASMFVHNLPKTNNKAVAWLDVPASMGAHTRMGTSWIRQAEIDAIADQLFEWMNSEEGKNLSFGVISFYKAQAIQISKTLKRLGADESRLRVGTVDSFQGMEFDVVFLSMVRTLPLGYKGTATSRNRKAKDPAPSFSAKPIRTTTEPGDQAKPARKSLFGNIRDALFGSIQKETRRAEETAAGIDLGAAMLPFLEKEKRKTPVGIDPEEQKAAQRLFGHLCLYNRLNVSMSRQKRLLVVAGDSALLSIDLADKFIPGLVDFYETCEKEGVILQCQQ